MIESRLQPFDLIFGDFVEEFFPRIRDVAGRDVDLDQFLLTAPALELLRALRPEEGLGDQGEDYLALVHAAFRFWSAGSETRQMTPAETRQLCGPLLPVAEAPGRARYIQMALRIVWGSLDGGEHFEPLDGWFAVPTGRGLRAVALFGVHQSRPGVAVLQVEGRLQEMAMHREDGSPLYAPTMAGGDQAGLHAIVSLGELLLLALRAEAMSQGGC